jgi:hypothetical protein
LGGRCEPRFFELLELVEAMSFRGLDLLAVLVEPSTLPSAATAWRALEARRNVAFTHPWSHAMLRLMETPAYRRQTIHRPGFVAEHLSPQRVRLAAWARASRSARCARGRGAGG